jgi:hypothetical protein
VRHGAICRRTSAVLSLSAIGRAETEDREVISAARGIRLEPYGSGEMSAIIPGVSSARRESFSIAVVSRAELSGCAPWTSTFADQRKDHRYYEILDDTLRSNFEYRYFAIVDNNGLYEQSNRSSWSIRIFSKGLALNEFVGFRSSDDSIRASLNCAL